VNGHPDQCPLSGAIDLALFGFDFSVSNANEDSTNGLCRVVATHRTNVYTRSRSPEQ